MSGTAVYTKGKPIINHEGTKRVLRYLPNPRSPIHPTVFNMRNLEDDNLKKSWGMGRSHYGYNNKLSRFSTHASSSYNEMTVKTHSKADLEKFMPNIEVGNKAMVTPVSMMHARYGHRVTHDLLHVYDRYATHMMKPIDHDKVNVHDDSYQGMHLGALGSRAKMFRWLRRKPQHNEHSYYLGEVRYAPEGKRDVEANMHRKIVKLASQGSLKQACEIYRKLVYAPPVEVYRALMRTCVPQGMLADALAIYEDGRKLQYVSHDASILHSLMQCAINAEHRPRVMWVLNTMIGSYAMNNFANVELEPIHQHAIAALALEWLLDEGATVEARELYNFFSERNMIAFDLCTKMAGQVLEQLKAGKKVEGRPEEMDYEQLKIQKEVRGVMPRLADRLAAHFSTIDGINVPPPEEGAKPQWLARQFPGIDVAFVLRRARFTRNRVDLLTSDEPAYIERAFKWLVQLGSTSPSASPITLADGTTDFVVNDIAPLTYFKKSKPSYFGGNVRVVPNNAMLERKGLTPTQDGYKFVFGNEHNPTGEGTRFVHETMQLSPHLRGEASKWLPRQPVHRDATIGDDFTQDAPEPYKHVDAGLHASVFTVGHDTAKMMLQQPQAAVNAAKAAAAASVTVKTVSSDVPTAGSVDSQSAKPAAGGGEPAPEGTTP